MIRFDRGSEFTCEAVHDLLKAFVITRVILKKGDSKAKGTIENFNKAVQSMHCARLPGYFPPDADGPRWHDSELMSYQAFHTHLIDWIRTWNTQHRKPVLGHRTPAQSWDDDMTPVYLVDRDALELRTLDVHPVLLAIKDDGVHWRKGRVYLAKWMHGEVGRKVRLRYRPYHEDQVWLYDPKTDESLGEPAQLTGTDNPELARAVVREAERLEAQLRKTRKDARKNSRRRYAATTTPSTPAELTVITDEEALARLGHTLPDLDDGPDPVPLPEPSDQWTRPRPRPLPRPRTQDTT
ncbi:hypothetical protein ATKI12_8903 [Kitasatospora sp. Ki12]